MNEDIHLRGLTHRYGSTTALEDLTLDIGGGTITALLGPSGCGKTTALKLIAGLLDPRAGTVHFGSRDVTDVPAERRGAVMVFQDHRLFPFLSAADNVAFGLRMRGVPRRSRQRRATAALERVGLAGLGQRRPDELSAGQRQRVALARALVLRPDVLLLDEPLANLDAHLRDGMRELILEVQREEALTVVVVTHDQEEAVVLAEDIALLFDGRLHQHGAPRTFFERPTTERAARFFGTTNLIPGVRRAGVVDTPLGALHPAEGAPDDAEVWLAIRPERLTVGRAVGDGPSVQGHVRSSAFLGNRTRATLDVAGQRLTVDVADDALADVGPGSVLRVGLPAEALWAVPRATGPGAPGDTATAGAAPDPAAGAAGGPAREPADGPLDGAARGQARR